MVMSDSRSSMYMSQGPSPRVVFIQDTLSTTRMFALTKPRRTSWSLTTVAITLNTLFSVFAITSKVSGFDGPYPASVKSALAFAGSYGQRWLTFTDSSEPGGTMPTHG